MVAVFATRAVARVLLPHATGASRCCRAAAGASRCCRVAPSCATRVAGAQYAAAAAPLALAGQPGGGARAASVVASATATAAPAEAPKPLLLKDYRPSNYLVQRVDLKFELHEAQLPERAPAGQVVVQARALQRPSSHCCRARLQRQGAAASLRWRVTPGHVRLRALMVGVAAARAR